jgi:ribonuclease P protein component
MLKKINRLQKDRDFQKVFKGSRVTKSENLIFRVHERQDQRSKIKDHSPRLRESEAGKHISNSKNDGIPHFASHFAPRASRDKRDDRSSETMKQWSNGPRGARFGFVVSNKVNKRATRRNALKRRLRATVRELMPSLDRNIDVIITVKRDFEYPYDYGEIKRQVEEGLTK